MSADETGNVSVEMVPEPESLRTERPFRSRLLRVFKGDGFVLEHGGGVGTLDMEAENPCTKLEVLFCSSGRLLAVQQNAFGAGKPALQPIPLQLLPGGAPRATLRALLRVSGNYPIESSVAWSREASVGERGPDYLYCRSPFIAHIVRSRSF